jgi:hypothetical protein
MKRLAPLVTAMALAACGAGEERVAMPLTAPGGAHRLVKDFVEICSNALVKVEDAEKLASERGWTAPAGAFETMKAAGMMAFEDNQGAILQIASLNFPHQEGKSCFVVAPFVATAEVQPEKIGATRGLHGGYEVIEGPAADKVGRGLWSFVGPDGDVVTISVTATGERIVQMNMNTSRRVSPPAIPKP